MSLVQVHCSLNTISVVFGRVRALPTDRTGFSTAEWTQINVEVLDNVTP
jgi:hypothetical protein